MSTPIDNGGPAFPVPDSHHANGQVQYGGYGMTLRDWFAGQETLSDYDHPDAWKSYDIVLVGVNGPHPDPKTNPLGYYKWECEARAKLRLMRADAMLAARKEPA